ncbi:hypothetical protein GEMRC1_007430 [Eukaryota sp. GEM-RC1]
MRLVQTLSGHFILQSNQFTQSPSNSDLDGQFDFWPGTIFSVGSSTSLVRETARFDGLQGRLRTISGGTINFNGYYNLTLNFNHNIGTINFLTPSDLELDSIHVTGGLLRFYDAKERPTLKNLFDLNSVSLTTAGTLRFMNVKQPMEIGTITQIGGWTNPYLQAPRRDDSFLFFDSTDHYLDIGSIDSFIGNIQITQVGDYLSVGDVVCRNSTHKVDVVIDAASFRNVEVSDTGRFDMSTIGKDLTILDIDVLNGTFIIDDVSDSASFDDVEVSATGRFDLTSVGNDLNVGNVDILDGTFTVDDIGDDADFKDFLLNAHGSFSIKKVGKYLDFDRIRAFDDSSFVVETVGLNATIRGDFLFNHRASASITHIGQWLVFLKGFTLQCHNNIVIRHIGHSLYTPESFMIHGK